MEPYQMRIIDEYVDNEVRRKRLFAFIRSSKFEAVDEAERKRLVRREYIMLELSNLLHERIANI